ncbi:MULTISPECIES: phosphotransferase [Cytobacillus]|uniref:Aminoglycoside phosphotransferase n=1 Tax=Cytobacillus firmus DS1 TaxID=1307436 RepID=W7KQD8_CYTFI|nr:phosphotransferase [Cytobacillus firmus]EWG08348.1 aminoglycoside phosphotransferase [Cytobacillus firmus DS1]MBG9549571.1 hypothetical protein [Cytobacillus firmus]MBG9601134.1 hypothetical protein [Cytobacillus firmus]MED1943263.1 phosphotransferase [Cytobacillus firmus]
MIQNDKVKIIKKYLSDLQINSIYFNNQGWDNEIVIINDDIVFRFPKKNDIKEKLIKESALLNTLSKEVKIKKSSIKVPKYQIIYDENRSLQFVYYSYLEGFPISEINDKEIIKTEKSAQDIGEFLTVLHTLDVSNMRKVGLKRNHEKKYWLNFFKSVQMYLYKYISEKEQEDINNLFYSFLNNSKYSLYEEKVIHGDLTDSNILYCKKENRITGIIDFTDSQIGDPAFDFAGFYWDLGPEFTKKIISNYKVLDSDKKLMYNRITEFYGLQPIFHELVYSIKEGIEIDIAASMKKFYSLRPC